MDTKTILVTVKVVTAAVIIGLSTYKIIKTKKSEQKEGAE